MDHNEAELLARLQLWRTPGLGPASVSRLLNYFGSAQAALEGSDAQMSTAGLKPETISSLRATPPDAAQTDLEWMHKAEHRHILLLEDVRYPAALRAIRSAPPLLFVAGHPELLNDPQIAMVGTRNPSGSGKENAHAFASHLARHGLCITSGLALGIDTYSHTGALDAGGTTIAVIATGLDIVYPARNRPLAERIVEYGAIVSEFPIGVRPQAQHFPRRNRLISGLSLGTVVVEAALQSGSLVTAQHAMEQGREVFAIPGSIHNPMARGCHRLIRQGAKLVETANDILEEIAPQLHRYLGAYAPIALASPSPVSSQRPSPAYTPSPLSNPSNLGTLGAEEALDAEEIAILATIGLDPVPVDQIVLQTGLTTDVVSSMLLMLELQGYVAACGGGRYMRLKPRD